MWTEDLKPATRSLRRDPGLALAVVALLALGLGANAAVFGVADRVLLRAPGGVRRPEELRRLYARTSWTIDRHEEARPTFSYPAFVALDSALAPRLRLAAYTTPDTLPDAVAGTTSVTLASFVSAGYFGTLGVRPALGRFFLPGEDAMGTGGDVVVLGYGYWRRRFGADRAVLGRAIRIAGRPTIVVGVAPAAFAGVDLAATDIWLPLASLRRPPIGDEPWYGSWRDVPVLRVIGRLPRNIPAAWLEARATVAYRRGERAGLSDTTATIVTGPIQEALAPSPAPAPLAAMSARLLAVALLVALIACANVANLLLARALDRRRELAIRLALGAPRRRIIRELVAQSLVLALLAGVVALGIGWWGARALHGLIAPAASWAGAALDVRVAAFTAALALILGALAAVPAALHVARSDLSRAMSAGQRAGGVPRSHLRLALLAAQTALSFVLLCGAGLFVRSLLRVNGIDLGYQVDRLLVATVQFRDPTGGYVLAGGDGHEAEMRAGFPAAAEALRTVPGVRDAAAASMAPLKGYFMAPLRVPGGDSVPRIGNRDPALLAVEPSYFATTGVRVLRGRPFSVADRVGSAPVVIVDETAAGAYWPEGALGKCIVIVRGPDSPCREVVGVVHDSHLVDLIEKPAARLYVPLAQGPAPTPRGLVVRAEPDALTRAIPIVRQQLRRVFPDADRIDVMPLAQVVAPQLRPWRVSALLFSALGLLALVVTLLGVYGAISYEVRRRAHELGVRIALGATAADILRFVGGRQLKGAYLGIALGASATLALGPVASALLYETSPRDPVVLLGAVGLLLAAGWTASLLPARRATRVDPAEIIRTD